MSWNTFNELRLTYNNFKFNEYMNAVTKQDVLTVLNKTQLSPEDFLILLSPVAAQPDILELLAQRAHRETVRQFGYTMQLFTPMYIADYCDNLCVYCGFNHHNKIARHKLSMNQIREEAATIAATGLKNILVLTGESQRYSPPDYILEACQILHDYFDNVAIEIYSLSYQDYKRMVELADVDGMTMFQECYNPEVYKQLHLAGPKANFEFRLDAPERACRAGMRTVNLGALLGLNDWREEAFFTGLHAHYLQHKYKDVEIAISTPRIRPCIADFPPRVIVNDVDIVQYITAYRIFMPRSGITLSSRESATMRNQLIRLGVTKISAGVTVSVGGHSQTEDKGQFDISDSRSVAEMSQMIYAAGYQPIYTDWKTI